MLQAAEGVLRHTAGKTRADYERDELLRDAVERKIEIVGEAARRVTKAFRDERTYSELAAVEGKSREREIARMLGGENETSLALAKAMLSEDRSSKGEGRRAKKATP